MSKSTTSGLLFVVSAPSGAGKTSLVSALLQEMDNLVHSISHTTRPKRPNEKEGEHYYFVSQAEYDQLKSQGEFVEGAEVFGQWYATSRSAIEKPLRQGKDVVLDIDWQGAAQVKKQFAERSIGIFLLPPSRQVLRERLQARAQDQPEVIDQRMAEAHAEMAHYQDYDYLIINDDFNEALREFKAIIVAERVRRARQEQCCRKLIETLVQ